MSGQEHTPGLAPCPFCGADPELEDDGGDGCISCSNCDIQLFGSAIPGVDLIAHWNGPARAHANLLAALKEARDLLTERKHGSSARSPAHNARLVIDAALPAAEGREP